MSNTTPVTPDRPTRRKLTSSQEKDVIRMLDAGVNLEVVAVQFGVHSNTVRNLRKRMAALADQARPGVPEDSGDKPESTGQEGAA